MKILVRVVFFAFFLFIILLPVVSATPGFNSAAGQTYQLTEDTPYSYNFTANVTNPETNMNFSF